MARVPVTAVHTRLEGWLGAALSASRRGRLSRFVTGPASAPIALFDPAQADAHRAGDWYGEHAGKWLQAAARAAAAGGDAALQDRVDAVVRHLGRLQRADGYLGCYAADRRFSVPQPPPAPSWDGAPAWRTWDVWVHACLLLGLLEVHRLRPQLGALDLAVRIGELCHRTFVDRGLDITSCGNHHGLSAVVLLEPVVRLHEATGDGRFLRLAERVVEQADAHGPLALVRRLNAGLDASEIATGKAYQLLWAGTGLARLHRASGRADLLHAAQALWRNVSRHHLTIGGGPFGGVGHRSRECFNPAAVFSPEAYVETCSTLAWIGLNRELLELGGDAAHADAIETAAYNELLAAAAPNGEDWCYYVFANGRRAHTTRWRCCKSSGALALEELPALAVDWRDDELRVQLYGSAETQITWADGGRLRLRQDTAYPADGCVRLQLQPDAPRELTLALRVPPWAEGATLHLDGEPVAVEAESGGWARVHRVWTGAERIEWSMPMPLRLHRRRHRNVQESTAPDGAPVRQEVQRSDWVAFGRGPLVYACGRVDGWRTEESLRLPDAALDDWIETRAETAAESGTDTEPATDTEPGAGDGAPALVLHPLGRGPITLQPAYRADGRAHGGWRTTWFRLPPDPAPPWTEEPDT